MKYVKNILAFVGAATLIFMVIAIASALYFMTGDRTANHTTVDKQDVRFVLNWSRLGEDRIKSVKHSYISERSLTGDHVDAHAIEITGVTIDELESQKIIKWTRGDRVEGLFKEAIRLASGFIDLDKLTWFPGKEQLLSDKIYLYPWAIMLHGEQVTSAQLIFALPSENMIYYVSVKV